MSAGAAVVCIAQRSVWTVYTIDFLPLSVVNAGAQLHRGESHCLSHAEIFFVTLALVLSWNLSRTSRLSPPRATAAQWKNSVSAAPPSNVATAANPILLYRNENPYGPSEKVLAVLRESAASGNRYPRTEYDTLSRPACRAAQCKSEQIVAALRLRRDSLHGRPRFPKAGQETLASCAHVSRTPEAALKLQPSKSWTFRSTNATSTISG